MNKMKKILVIFTVILALIIQNLTNFALASDYDPLSWPAPSKKITSPFGPRDGKMHLGIDISFINANVDIIKSSIAGNVMYSDKEYGTYGNLVVINGYDRYYGDNPYGTPYVDISIQTRYAHLNSKSVFVGNNVGSSTNIGVLGNTGGSKGPHLHYETRIANSINSSHYETESFAIDPVYYFHYNVPLTYSLLRATTEKSNNKSQILIDENGNIGIYKWPIFMTYDYIYANPLSTVVESGINKYDLLILAEYMKSSFDSYNLLISKAQEINFIDNERIFKLIEY